MAAPRRQWLWLLVLLISADNFPPVHGRDFPITSFLRCIWDDSRSEYLKSILRILVWAEHMPTSGHGLRANRGTVGLLLQAVAILQVMFSCSWVSCRLAILEN